MIEALLGPLLTIFGMLAWIALLSKQRWRLFQRRLPSRFIHDELKQAGATAIQISAPYLSDGRGYHVYKVEFLSSGDGWQMCEVYVPRPDRWGLQVIWDFDGDPFHRLDFELTGDTDFVAQQTELAQVMKQLRARGLL